MCHTQEKSFSPVGFLFARMQEEMKGFFPPSELQLALFIETSVWKLLKVINPVFLKNTAP